MRIKRTAEEWRELIQEQMNCGLSATDFCKTKSIHPNLFYRKRKQFDSCHEEHNEDFVELVIPGVTETNKAIKIIVGNISIFPGNSESQEYLTMLFSAALEAHNASLR